jgi:hypothetical protein
MGISRANHRIILILRKGECIGTTINECVINAEKLYSLISLKMQTK